MTDNAEPVVIKAFAVIEVILAARRPLSLPELAEALGRPKQTVHRTARQLEEHGFLYREPVRDRYAIGPKLFDISKDVFGWCIRYAPRNAVLARLVDKVSETCNVGILDGDCVLYLDRVESNFPLRAELHPGSRVPVHCTGLGKLFLAYLPGRTRKRILERLNLKAYTARTLTDPEALEADCAKTRARGYSVNNEEYHDGIISVAVPVHSDADHVISGLAIHAPAARMNVEAAIKHVPVLKEYAALIAEDFMSESDTA
ncbi:IclR family transcriptional regulator [Thalassospiraceae bacterium LMO-JJ14]|nr:IclR family transcriptional regulator [Thalassospiraceae bacterium LMO-JJ14]